MLHRIAKKFALVRNIEIQLATLPQEAFDRPHHPAYSPSLPAVLSRLGKISGKQYNISQISRFVKMDKAKNPEDQFSEQTTRILQEAKIHAEIQLIAYCEIQSPPLFPRAIASSKDACFLCHAFIQNHDKMHTSRTHGRLYPGWRLPMLLSLRRWSTDSMKSLLTTLDSLSELETKVKWVLTPTRMKVRYFLCWSRRRQ